MAASGRWVSEIRPILMDVALPEDAFTGNYTTTLVCESWDASSLSDLGCGDDWIRWPAKPDRLLADELQTLRCSNQLLMSGAKRPAAAAAMLRHQLPNQGPPLVIQSGEGLVKQPQELISQQQAG